MTIRRRISLLQVVVALVIAAMGAITVVHIRSTTYHIDRLQWAQRQLDANTRLAVIANRYSEQIAELLLTGEPEREDFDSARVQLNDVLTELRELTTEEVAFLTAHGQRRADRPELARVTEIRALLREIDRAVERLLLLNQEGRRDEAVALFRSEIENRLDAEVERLIASAIADERAEATASEVARKQSERRLTIGTGVALALLLTVTLGSSLAFTRSVMPPLNALAEGSVAIGRGDLNHRIPEFGNDELGLVSRRFNGMRQSSKSSAPSC